jgi:flavin-dependent dehydrogenase
MPEPFDAIVAGGGVAAAVAAVLLTRSGRRIAWASGSPGRSTLELGGLRWRTPDGASGGPTLSDLPTERRIVARQLFFLQGSSCAAFEFDDPNLSSDGSVDAMDAARVEAWASEVVRAAGGERLAAVSDLRLAATEGRVQGVLADGRALTSDVTILTDPAVAGEARGPPPTEWRHAARFDVGATAVENRFTTTAGEGLVVESILGGAAPAGLVGGFVYPLERSLVAGIVVRSGPGRGAPPDPAAAFRTFCDHPSITPFLRGASPAAIAKSTAAEGPAGLGSPGLLRAGGAAAFSYSDGALLPSVDYGLATAVAAVQATLRSPDRAGLVPPHLAYVTRLRTAGILAQVHHQRRAARRTLWNPRYHRSYPVFLNALFHDLLTESGGPKQPVAKVARAARRRARVSSVGLALDAARLLGGNG